MLTVAMGKLTDEVRWDCPQKGTFADDMVGTGERRPGEFTEMERIRSENITITAHEMFLKITLKREDL